MEALCPIIVTFQLHNFLYLGNCMRGQLSRERDAIPLEHKGMENTVWFSSNYL